MINGFIHLYEFQVELSDNLDPYINLKGNK